MEKLKADYYNKAMEVFDTFMKRNSADGRVRSVAICAEEAKVNLPVLQIQIIVTNNRKEFIKVGVTETIKYDKTEPAVNSSFGDAIYNARTTPFDGETLNRIGNIIEKRAAVARTLTNDNRQEVALSMIEYNNMLKSLLGIV